MKYAAFVWSPHTAVNINKLEAVQRRATCFVMLKYDRHSSILISANCIAHVPVMLLDDRVWSALVKCFNLDFPSQR